MWCMGCTSDIQAACDTWNSEKAQAGQEATDIRKLAIIDH